MFFSAWQKKAIIYLRCTLLYTCCCLPFSQVFCNAGKRAAYLPLARNAKYTWHYSAQGLPVLCITTQYRKLLPHVFTLIPTTVGTVIFCGTISYNACGVTAGCSPVGCPTLSRLSSSQQLLGRDSRVYSNGKNRSFF